MNMVCRVPAWQNAVVWTQQHLIEVKDGPKKDNPDGHQQTVFPRFCLQPGQKFKTLPSLLIHPIMDMNKVCNGSTPQNHCDYVMVVFLLDNICLIRHTINMLSGMRIYTSDSVWCQILGDLGATVTDTVGATDINFDKLNLKQPVTITELKAAILGAFDADVIINELLGKNAKLTRLQKMMVVALHKSGGMNGEELKIALGYAPDAATHTVDTAIYQLRKIYGHEFIKNDGGVYKIGKL